MARHLLLRLAPGVLLGVGRRWVAKLHPQLAPADVEHTLRVEPPVGEGEKQASLF